MLRNSLANLSLSLNAFRNAAYMDYDLKIQEDAWYNYAKISYDVGNPYETVPQVLSKISIFEMICWVVVIS